MHRVRWRGWRRAPRAEPEAGEGSLLALASLALVAGAGSGLVVAMFRLTLAAADRWRGVLIARAHGMPLVGFVLVVAGCAAAVALAAWLVRRFSPYASGSGIPQVEAALTGDLPPAPPRLIPVKFSGGVLAIGAGMALGREGPSVQMGAVIADLIGKACGRSWPDMRTLLASGAGAGLAVAFNAPIAGAVFVLEELVRRLETRIAIAAFGASSTAILVSRLFLGDAPDFQVTVSAQAAANATGPLPYAVAATWPLYLVLGVVAGVAASLYNRAVLGALTVAARLDQRWPVEIQAAAIGALVGIIGWFAPGLIGGGEAITQRLLAGGFVICDGAARLARTLRFGCGVLCGAHPGRAVRAVAGGRCAARAAVRRARASRLSRSRHRARGVRRGRHGRVLYRGGAVAGDRHRSRHRDDRGVHDPVADAGGVLCGNRDRQSAAHRADLRCVARARR